MGETDPATRDAVDAHLMACDDCGVLLDDLVAHAAGVRDAVRSGAVGVAVGGGFVERLPGLGIRVREYRVAPNGSVNCTVAPDDDVLVSRLEVPLAGVQRLDMAMELSLDPGVVYHSDDVPFDPAAGEVLFLAPMAQVRARPTHTVHMTLVAHDGTGSRELGRYEFRHSPWDARPPAAP
nr:zf-HC2 domain-containing protein [Ramlibacter algicola]